MRRILLFLILTSPLLACAQDLTGVWQGHFSSGNGERSSLFDVLNRYKFEVQIAQTDKKFEAVTYSYLSTVFYGKAAAAGTVNQKTGKVLLQEGKLLELREENGTSACSMTCFLQYFKAGDEEFLEGKYVSMNIKDSTNCGRGTVFLRKVNVPDFPEEPFLVERKKELTRPKTSAADSIRIAGPNLNPSAAKRPAAGPTRKPSTNPHPAIVNRHTDSAVAHHAPPSHVHRPPATQHPAVGTPEKPLVHATIPERSTTKPAADSSSELGHKFATITPRILLDRSNTLVRSLTVNTREVVLNIYDDGIIDNDTVSVYLDNKMVINHAMLTDKPLILTLHLDEDNDYHELVMVADNEGTIPPNTSLMIVRAGDKEYKVNISSSLQKNATVTFKYVKPN